MRSGSRRRSRSGRGHQARRARPGHCRAWLRTRAGRAASAGHPQSGSADRSSHCRPHPAAGAARVIRATARQGCRSRSVVRPVRHWLTRGRSPAHARSQPGGQRARHFRSRIAPAGCHGRRRCRSRCAARPSDQRVPRQPTGIGVRIGTQLRPGPANKTRASLSYSRVLACRGSTSGSSRAAARQIPYVTWRYQLSRHVLRRSRHAVRSATVGEATRDLAAYSLALALRLRRGAGSPVPSV